MMASIPQVGDIQKASIIYKAALYYSFLNSLKGWKREAFLKYQSRNPYSIIGRIHVL